MVRKFTGERDLFTRSTYDMVDWNVDELDEVSDKTHNHEAHTDCSTSLQKLCNKVHINMVAQSELVLMRGDNGVKVMV